MWVKGFKSYFLVANWDRAANTFEVFFVLFHSFDKFFVTYFRDKFLKENRIGEGPLL